MALPQMLPCQTRVLGALFLIGLCSASSSANEYVQTNLVSNVPGLAATTDPNLVNPWGVSFTPTSPFWVSDQGTGVSTLYNGAGAITPLVVTVPSSGSPGPAGPTGQVANTTTGFALGGTPARFIFDTLGGTIDAWTGGTTATVVSTVPGAVFTGLAEGSAAGSNYLYAADVRSGVVRVFDTNFNQVTATTFAGKFVDPALPAGLAPFNVQLLNGLLYVEYAAVTATGAPLPGGVVDIFDTSGNFVRRVSSNGALYAPWGVTLAPSTFGAFGGDLLVGNFGNGEINAFNPVTGTFIDTLDGPNGQPIVNDFLWALDFRTTGPGVNPNALYFTAGINNQQGGLFGEITNVTPEPGTLVLVGMGMVSVAAVGWRKVRG
jgi:uncharacterized protein (TIGR03118 family)